MQKIFYEKEIDLLHQLKELVSLTVDESIDYKIEDHGVRAVGSLAIKGEYISQEKRHFLENVELDVYADDQKIIDRQDFHLKVEDFHYDIQDGNLKIKIEAAARQIRFDTGSNLFANSSDTIIVNVEPKRHPAGVLAWYPPVCIRMKRKTSRKRKVLPHPSKNAPTGSRRRNVTIPIRRRIKPYCNQAI